MTPVRCQHCNAPAVERADRIALAHLSWCPRSRRPPVDRQPVMTTTPDVDPVDQEEGDDE